MHRQGNPVLRSCQLVLSCTLLALTSVAQAQRSVDAPADGPIVEEIVVEETAGAVKVKVDNRWRSPSTGMTMSLPATVSTGTDGSIRIRQAATVISVASNTAIELLEGTEPGSPLQRVVQNQGSAFYDIAPRESSRLRVETPYLVAVIKGTEFNVTVAAETSTVALFEGRLRIEAPDIGDVVDLYEGQIAKRHKDDPGITVLNMQDSEPVARGDAAPPAGGTVSGDEGNGDIDIGDGGVEAGLDAHTYPGIDLDDAVVDVGLDAGPDLDGLDPALDSFADIGDNSAELSLDAGFDLAGGDIDAALDAGVDLGDAVVDLGMDAALDLDGGDIDLGLDADIDLGGASLDAGLDAGVDLGDGDIDLAADGGLDLGDVAADVGVDAVADLDQGDIDAVLDAGIDLGGTSVDAGLDAGVDLGDGDLDAVVNGSVDLGVAGIDADAEIGAEIDLGDLDELVDSDLDLDLLGDDDSDSVEDEPADLPIDPGDLFELLRL